MVEDDERAVRYFPGTLSDLMPDAELKIAESIPTAEAVIEEYSAKGVNFDAVILDCNLPSAAGTREMNTSLCPLVSRKHGGALVLHCSAYTKDPVLERHIREAHGQWPSPRALVVAKGKDWDTILVRTLATDRVERKLGGFFQPEVGLPAGRSNRGGATRRLAQLTSDIEQFWNLLPESTQERIRRDFDVFTDGDRVQVTLGGSRE
jgi:hypothetical protein